MNKPNQLQEQRRILRQFRQAAEKRATTEQEIQTKQKNGLAEAAGAVSVAKQNADGLQNQTHQNYQKAQDILESVGLARLLPEQVPPAGLTLQAGDVPGKELTRVASKTDPIFDQINKNVVALKQWRARRKMQKQMLFFAGAATLLVLTIALIYTYQAWETNRRYEQAVAASAAGEWEKARSLFYELGDYKDSYILQQENSYQQASAALAAGEWEQAHSLFRDLGDYKDSYILQQESSYQQAIATLASREWEEARNLFDKLGAYEDSQALIPESYYQQAVATLASGEWEEAHNLFKNLGDYKDSRMLAFEIVCLPPVNPTFGDTCTRRTVSMTMIYVPGGTFQMGSDGGDTDEQPIHEVRLDSFWIDRTEVTNAQYNTCVSAGICTPSESAGDPDFNGALYPVVNISWNAANRYCAWAGGQLPTEAQWEYAARGPQAHTFPWGNTPPNCDLAQYGDCRGKTKPVGSFSPVGDSWIGAADMAGNAFEWVADWYDSEYYAVSPMVNPAGPITGATKTLRGGSWLNFDIRIRAANRGYYLQPDSRRNIIGFRCAYD